MIQTCAYLYSSNFTPQVKEACNQSQICNRKSISRNTTHRQFYHLQAMLTGVNFFIYFHRYNGVILMKVWWRSIGIMELYLSVILAQAASVMSCDILDHVADEI